MGLGVLGVVIADLVVTAALMTILIRRFAPLIRPMFSVDVLRQSLAFGLPRVPHAAAQQVIAVGDKFILAVFRPIAEVGIYSMGVSFGLTQKLFLSAFEYAWAPFYYSAARERGAAALFATVTTYGVAALALLTAGLSAIARDLLDLMTRGVFVEAAPIVAWTAIGVFLQGVYLLTSIGLNITKQTGYYPASTIAAAVANIALNYALIPRYGMIGAAWANAAAYAVQAGLAFTFSQRVYPVRYEYRPSDPCAGGVGCGLPGGRRDTAVSDDRWTFRPGCNGGRRIRGDSLDSRLLQTRGAGDTRSAAPSSRAIGRAGGNDRARRRDHRRRVTAGRPERAG